MLNIKENKEYDIRELSSINTQKGLQLFVGNKKLYTKILKDFYKNYKDFDIATLPPDEHKRAIHTLKGLSANIAAETLYKIVLELDVTHNQRLYAPLMLELQIVLNELKTLDTISMPTQVLLPIDKLKRDELFTQLQIAIYTNRPKNCENFMTQLESYKLDRVDKQLFDKIKSLLQEYKFKEAGELIDEFIGTF